MHEAHVIGIRRLAWIAVGASGVICVVTLIIH